jgi:DMSO/TMAO reductase YedYZ molybdopterin-dependent catalytic subunit
LGRRRFLAYAVLAAGGLGATRWGQSPAGRQALAPLVGSSQSGLFHYYRAEYGLYHFDPAQWRLKVDGQVSNPVSLRWSDLSAWPLIHQVSSFHCVSGWRVSDVRWQGWRFQPLLALVQPLPEARFATFEAEGGVYRDSLALSDLLLPNVLLASHLGGAPLIPEQGAPLRVVIPRMYGYKGVKWVSRITFTATQESGYWEDRGYPQDGVSPPPNSFVSQLLRINVDPPQSQGQ